MTSILRSTSVGIAVLAGLGCSADPGTSRTQLSTQTDAAVDSNAAADVLDAVSADVQAAGTIATLLPKTGVYVPLYMYPGTTGAVHWQKAVDVKMAHPSVPMVAAFNPSTGPGDEKNKTFATWVKKLQDAGIIVLGYTYSEYGARAASLLKADIDKYAAWYAPDGVFIDVFANKSGYEDQYRALTAHAKSLGMKLTMGNPGTDVPQSYLGTVDVIDITEGVGYMPISWLQYCVKCDADKGWHYKVDKRNFSLVRYAIPTLDTTFVANAAKWVGLMYISDGTDADGRWFHLPPYFEALVAALDK